MTCEARHEILDYLHGIFEEAGQITRTEATDHGKAAKENAETIRCLASKCILKVHAIKGK